MAKLAYANDQQIIDDAAQMLIEDHLRWSGSDRGLPSKDRAHVRGYIYSILMENDASRDSWNDLSEEDKEDARAFNSDMAKLLFKEAAEIADRKWLAAMTLLGINQ